MKNKIRKRKSNKRKKSRKTNNVNLTILLKKILYKFNNFTILF